MHSPRVSIVCTFLDREAFLEDAIQSVLTQEFGDYELLLIDDGSSDASTAIAQAHADQHNGKVRILSHPGRVNRGISASRNLGLAEARGEYIAFIDSDDVWVPGKLAGQVAILDARPDVDIVCGRVNYWSSWDGGEDDHIQTGGIHDACLEPPDTFLALYPVGNGAAPSPSEIMIRQSALERIGGFEDAFPGYYDDQVLFVKAYLRLRLYCADTLWVHYRLHAGSCTSATRRAGDYVARRRAFFQWLDGHVRDPASGATDPMRAAVRRELELLGQPLLWKVAWRVRRLRQVLRRWITAPTA